MGNTNAFEGLDSYSVNLIHYKSRRLIGYLGMTESDREDIEQDLAIHLRQNLSKHDPARGSVKTFINCVLDNRIRAIIKSRSSSVFDCRTHAYSLDTVVQDEDADAMTRGDMLDADEYQMALGNAGRPTIETIELRIDVERAVASLPPDMREVCMLLSRTTVAAAARELGISRAKLYDIMRRLRDMLRDHGIDLYL